MDLRQEKILLTGGHGFLGTHVHEALLNRGYDEVLRPTRQECDLLEPGALDAYLAERHPSLILHLAAKVGGIKANRDRPAEFFYENLRMGTELLHSAWRHGVQKVVTTGTVCAYPKGAPVPLREDSLWDGFPEETNAPYGMAKKMQLLQSQVYRQQYGFNAVWLLMANLYGPGDNFDPDSSHVIPGLVRRFLEAHEANRDEVVCWGDGTPTREFLYVKDAAQAILNAAESYDEPAPLNIGAGTEVTILELAELIAELTGYEGTIHWDTTLPNGQPRRCLDTSRAASCLKWTANTPLRSGLQETICDFLRQRHHAT